MHNVRKTVKVQHLVIKVVLKEFSASNRPFYLVPFSLHLQNI